jgi:hypothetical protein
MVDVDQPLGRRGDRASIVNRLDDCAIGVEQYRFVVDESPCQRMDLGRLQCDGLCAREAPRVLLCVPAFSSAKKVPSMLNMAISSPLILTTRA